MKLAPEYVDRLLLGKNEGAGRDLGQLDSFWSVRAKINNAGEIEGLSRPELVVHLILLYLADVGNGGHTQYFMNPAGRFAPETVKALREIGAHQVAETLSSAIAVFPREFPGDRAALLTAVGELDSVALETLSRADKRIGREVLRPGVDELALSYLSAHKNEVLAIEQL